MRKAEGFSFIPTNHKGPSFFKNSWQLILLLMLPFVVRVPELIGWINSNPILLYSGLGTKIQGGIISGLSSADPNVAYTSQALGHRAALDWLNGRIPLWNPYEGLGVPLAGEMQSAAFFPLTFLLYFQNGQLYFHIILQIIAGVATYLLLRKLNLSKGSSVLGGVLYEFNGTFAWFGHAPVNPIPFLPLLLLGIEVTRETIANKKHGGWWLISIALALSLYAGFPETAYINGLLAACLVILRFFQFKKENRVRFLLSIIFGVVIGILIATPIILPFIEYLKNSNIGSHAGLFGDAHLPIEAFLQLFLPYIYGNIQAYSGLITNQLLSVVWGNVGGYIGLAFGLLIIMSLFGKYERALKFVLFIWILVALAKTFGYPPVVHLLNLLPFMKDTAFYRYSPPSFELAAIILISFTFEQIIDRDINIRVWWLGIAIAGFVLIVSLVINRKFLIQLISVKNVIYWVLGSIFLELIVILFLIAIYYYTNNKRIRGVISAFVLLTLSLFYFYIPIMSNPRNGSLDLNGIKFLQTNLKINRFYSLGPIQPNYGSYFGLSTINYNDLPISKRWVDYIQSHLDNYSDPITFNGNYHSNTSLPSPVDELRSHLSNYEEVGVKYIVTPSGYNPFIVTNKTLTQQTGNIPLALSAGQQVRGLCRATQIGSISEIGIFIGNYNNTSNGKLHVKLSNGQNESVEGEGDLKASQDNAYFYIHLNHTIEIKKGEQIQFQFEKEDGNKPVALWLWPTNSENSQQVLYNGKNYNNQGFKMMFRYSNNNSPNVNLVYHDTVMDIYQLPNPKPYFELVSSNGNIVFSSRTSLTVDVDKPTVLIRRELYYPGWYVKIDGSKAPVNIYNSIFQQVTIPSGRHVVQFYYWPNYMNYALAAFAVGLVLLCINIIRSKRGEMKSLKEEDARG